MKVWYIILLSLWDFHVFMYLFICYSSNQYLLRVKHVAGIVLGAGLIAVYKQGGWPQPEVSG